MRVAYLSKSPKSDERQVEQEVRYLRRMLAEIGKDITLPPSLHGDMLRPKLDGITPDGLKVKTPFNAGDFLRSKVFSLQSVVSYALAFVVIVAVAYAMGGGGPALVDGNIAISKEAAAEDSLTQMESFAVAPVDQSIESPQDMLADDADVEEDAPEAAIALDEIAGEADSTITGGMSGVGGGAIAHPLGEDAAYNYIYRHNDNTDPDKTGYPLTIEIVSKSDNSLVTYIDIADMDSIEAFFLLDNSFAVTGSGGSLTIARAYTLDTMAEIPAVTELFALSQPGEYVDARLVDQILHLVTLQAGEVGDLETVRMPDSLTDTACIVTTANLLTGDYRQVAYLGAEEDMRISIQNRNIYIPYSGARPEDAPEDTDELYMTQIKLEGVEQEMVMVP
jgi:hypothetical protein